MNKLILTSPKSNHPLKPLVQSALSNELRLLKSGIYRTEQNIRKFETRYNMSTNQFLDAFANNQLDESLEFAEWIGEHRMLKRLQEKAQILEEISFVD